MKRKLAVFGSAGLTLLVWVGTAVAASSEQSGYGGGGGVQGEVEGTGGALPFTGLDLALLVGGGLLLIVVGAGVRRLTRARS
jgi:hypothetical protein